MTADEWLDWPPLPAPEPDEALLRALCHAAMHDGRGGRLGLPYMWREVVG